MNNLLVICLACVPIMLCGKPLFHLLKSRKQKFDHVGSNYSEEIIEEHEADMLDGAFGENSIVNLEQE